MDLVRVRGFDLVLDLEAREQRDVFFVQLELAQRGRHEALHVFLRFGKDGGTVDQDLADVVVQVVAQRADDGFRFLVDQERGGAALRGFLDGLPDFLEVREVPLQFFGRPANAGGPDDGAHVLRNVHRFKRFAQLVPILTFDAAGNSARTRVIRHQHEEAAGEADEGGERCALGAALFLFDLDDDVLAF